MTNVEDPILNLQFILTNDKWQILNNPPQGPMMPPQIGMPPQMGPARPKGWRERWMQRFGMVGQMPRAKELTIPNWITGKSIVFFFVVMFACWFAFGYVPNFDLVLTAILSVVIFFYGGSAMAKSWSRINDKTFVRNVFLAGFIVHFLWVLYCYYIFNPQYFGNSYGETADVEWYMPFGKAVAEWIGNGFDIPISELRQQWDSAIDDVGYPMWLAIGYTIWWGTR